VGLGDDGKPRNLVHRDISPDNLMINRQGLTKILDFGIAKGRKSLNLTKTGEIKGKLPYLPPEYFLGEPFEHAGDLYALGATLYWMLTGQRPFSGDTDLLLMKAVTEKAPTPPSKLNPAIPRFVEDLILQLLDKDPNARPASGAKLAEQLLGDVPAERSKVASFVVRMTTSPAVRGHKPISTDGFLPAEPVFDQLSSSGPNVISPTADTEVRRDEGSTTQQGPVEATPSEISMVSVESAVPLAQEAPRSRRAAAGVAIIAVLLGVAGIFAVFDNDDDAETAPVLAAGPAEPDKPADASPAEVKPAEVKPVEEPPLEKEPVAVAPDPAAKRPKPITRRKKKPRPAALTTVKVTGRSSIWWLDSAGTKLGSGNAELKIPAGARTIIAYDTSRSVRTTVPVSSSIAYNKLPKGSLAVLAAPDTKVFAGRVALGRTPFIPPVKLVAGKYMLKLKHEGKTKTATVVVKPGKTAKLKIEMTK
jgi:serine/threonine-protein kinase